MSTSARKQAAVKPTPKVGKTPSEGSTTLGLDEIKTLIALVSKEPFQEFEFEAGDIRFRIRKDGPAAPTAFAQAPMVMGSPVSHVTALSMPAPIPVMQIAAPAAAEVPESDPSIHYITSPIVGTFYRSANPSSPSFVQVGDTVRPGQTLCIVEAMKLMNEIECDMAGEVVKMFIENGTPVEYGERLFAIKVS